MCEFPIAFRLSPGSTTPMLFANAGQTSATTSVPVVEPFPIALVVALWATLNVVVPMIQLLHALRATVLGASKIETTNPVQAQEIRKAALRNSYVWILGGIIAVFLAVMAI